ncbi:MAG: aminotransferase class I/II-fold pyridoxal phosphate-dependent enzyme [Leptospirales bacterium]|nr:aminotransferase class I/II-fold pyridoxal phosphate-dependent enzyme [Leptospirales bacterium]
MQSAPALPLSERMSRIDSSEIRRVFQLAGALKDPINLSIGQPHYPAPLEVREAAAQALRDGRTAYTETQGIRPLRERIARKFAEVNGFQVDPDHILVSSGVSSLISLLFQALVDPGDRILLTDPAFLIYRSLLQFMNASVEYIPENFSPEDLAAVNPRGLKLIIFCSPSNPSGRIMSEDQIRQLGELADRSGALLVSDEIYECFDYEGRFHSAAAIYDRAVTLMGFSKTYSMTGLRLAAAAGPAELIKAMTTLQQYTVVCAPAPIQHAGIVALDLDMSGYVAQYKRNRDYCVSRLQGRLNFESPQGAFYIYPQIPGTDREFVERAIREQQLLLVPGRIFSRAQDRVRISYAAEESTLKRGMDALLALLG